MNWKQMELTGWGRSSVARTRACRPERESELGEAVAEAGSETLIAHGAGRSYGDAALNDGGRTLLTTRLNRMLSFDAGSGELVAEPGVPFRDLVDTFAPRGFMPPTSPGTAFATVGGAVAADVHGKNHDRHGSFGDHVQWIDLLTADGQTRRVSPESDPELFAATIGGMGLTGIMRAVCFRLRGQATPFVRVREQRIRDLDEFLAAFAQVRDTATFSVGWIDALARGGRTGRGILETAEFAPAGAAPLRPEKTRGVPLDFPTFALNPVSIRIFNEMYYRRVPESGRERVVPFRKFLYPLDAIHHWNRIYGKPGFYQFQCVVPDGTARGALATLLSQISQAGSGSFLAVLKTLGREGRGYLSFPMRGYTLALDFPRRRGTEELIRRLESVVLANGGRVYLAKDALLSPESLRAMYPKVPQLEAVLARIDPNGLFSSDMARRLALKPRRAAA
ncbi:MAG TPA: FAD-binding oxidoreductase [Alphaproteobacteria bacterium]|nr:FAD-binding oxidoreductase [Alphaproteobacteria bacterium]